MILVLRYWHFNGKVLYGEFGGKLVKATDIDSLEIDGSTLIMRSSGGDSYILKDSCSYIDFYYELRTIKKTFNLLDEVVRNISRAVEDRKSKANIRGLMASSPKNALCLVYEADFLQLVFYNYLVNPNIVKHRKI